MDSKSKLKLLPDKKKKKALIINRNACTEKELIKVSIFFFFLFLGHLSKDQTSLGFKIGSFFFLFFF